MFKSHSLIYWFPLLIYSITSDYHKYIAVCDWQYDCGILQIEWRVREGLCYGSVFRIAPFKILPQKSDYLHYYARIMFRNPISAIVITLSCVFRLQVAFMPYRVNGQYIMEGLASSFLFSMGGLGFIILDKSNAVGMSKLNRFLLLFLGFVCVLVSFFTCRVFMRMKLP